MLKKKAINRFLLTTIIFFIIFIIYNLKLVPDNKKEEKVSNTRETVYTLNDDNYISKAEVYVGKVFTLEDIIKEKLEIMTEENNKNALLPSYFNPILPENTRVLDVVVEDSIVKVYFSEELNSISEEQSEKMIEAIVYTITDDNILGIEIYVDGKLLKYVPHSKKELPTILTKDYGINKTYDVIATKDINKTITAYYVNYQDNYYEVPVTKYVNDSREKIEIIFDNLSSSVLGLPFISLFDNIKLINYKITENSIIINFNREISKDELNLLSDSIFNNYDVKKIIILDNNQKKYEKTKKNIEN